MNCLLSKLANSNYSPSRLWRGFFGTFTSLMETSTALLLQRQRGQGNLCDVPQTSEVALHTLCAHHTPTGTNPRESPPAEGCHAGAAFLWDAWIEVFKDWVTQTWYQKRSSSIFDGASLIPEMPVAMGGEEGALFSITPRPQTGNGERTQVALHVWAPLSTLPGRTNHIIKFVHSSWPGTWCMLICISYFFRLFGFFNEKILWVQCLEINRMSLLSRYLSSDLPVTEIL